MDCRVKCSDRGHSRHLFGDMTDTFSARQVDGCDLVGGKKTPYLPSFDVGLMARRSPRKACGTFQDRL